MRSIATVVIAVLTGCAAFVLFAGPQRSDTFFHLVGRVLGFTVTPFVIGYALAWLFDKVRAGTNGAVHRRTNWIAFAIALLSILGNLAQRAT